MTDSSSPDAPVLSPYETAIDGKGRVTVDAEWTDFDRSPAGSGGVNTQLDHVHLDRNIDAHFEHARAQGALVEMAPEAICAAVIAVSVGFVNSVARTSPFATAEPPK
jgi:hypothetical protein